MHMHDSPSGNARASLPVNKGTYGMKILKTPLDGLPAKI
jgi:hypothetical protein